MQADLESDALVHRAMARGSGSGLLGGISLDEAAESAARDAHSVSRSGVGSDFEEESDSGSIDVFQDYFA